MQKEIRALSDKNLAKNLSVFFKTGKGEYAEGDLFLGIKVPETRKVVKKYVNILALEEIVELLQSKYHEERLAALLILKEKYRKAGVKSRVSSVVIPTKEESRKSISDQGRRSLLRRDDRNIDENVREKIFNIYLQNTKFINNWDLVDLTAPDIVGDFLRDKDREILYKLAESKNLWERRIAVLSAFCYIKDGESGDAIKIAQILLNDKHDLIHKAVGWMLREVGGRCSIDILRTFLDQHVRQMPRTMLRYAIEKFPERERQRYLRRK